MKKEKGILKLAFLVIMIIIIVAVFFWVKYFSEPMTTVVTGGAEQYLPALDKAKKVGETVNKAVQAKDETAEKIIENAQQQ
jgi:uncharacterized protein (UPF0333 family)